jgi:hypothetical protein
MNKWLITFLIAVAGGLLSWLVETKMMKSTPKERFTATYLLEFDRKDSNAIPQAGKGIESMKRILSRSSEEWKITHDINDPLRIYLQLEVDSVNDNRVVNILTTRLGVQFTEMYPEDSVFAAWDTIRAVQCEIYPDHCANLSHQVNKPSDSSLVALLEKHETVKGNELFKERIYAPEIAQVAVSDTSLAGKIFRHPRVTGLFPKAVRYCFGLDPRNTGKGNGMLSLYMIWEKTGDAHLDNNDIESAEQSYSVNGEPVITFTFTREGARQWEALTTSNAGKAVAVICGGQVVSAPVVNGPITEGSVEISGFTKEQIGDMLPNFNYRDGRMPPVPSIKGKKVEAGPVPANHKLPVIPALVFVILFIGTMLVFKTLKSTRPAPVSGEK